MKLEGRIHCEGPDCEANAHVGVDTMAAERLPVGWLKVIDYTRAEDHVAAFCNYDCAMKHFAQYPPPVVISAGPE